MTGAKEMRYGRKSDRSEIQVILSGSILLLRNPVIFLYKISSSFPDEWFSNYILQPISVSQNYLLSHYPCFVNKIE